MVRSITQVVDQVKPSRRTVVKTDKRSAWYTVLDMTIEITQQARDRILEAIAAGERISDVCVAAGLSVSTLFRARRRDADFARQFDAALVESVELDMMLLRDMARLEPSAEQQARIDAGLATPEDLSLVSRARTRESQFRILSWYISRRAPSKYGDKLALDVTGKLDMRQVLLGAERRLALLTARRTPVAMGVVTTSKEPVARG